MNKTDIMDHDLLVGKITRCKLTLPEGLKELMSDISREVLRAQPADIYDFIANYLSALLVSRDNLTIAAHICTHICECECEPELLRELLDIGLNETDARVAHDIIMKYFTKPKVHESSLFGVLLKKTSIDPDLIPLVLNAVRVAYLRYQARKVTKYEVSSDSDGDEVAIAAAHTLNLYRQTRPMDEVYGPLAEKIQTSYRAYGVRRGDKGEKDDRPETRRSATMTNESAFSPYSINSECESNDMDLPPILHERINKVASISPSDSFYKLPHHGLPYNTEEIHCLAQLEEAPETEHAHIDYTEQYPHVSLVNERFLLLGKKNKKTNDENDPKEIKNNNPTSNKVQNYSFNDDSTEETASNQYTEVNKMIIKVNGDEDEDYVLKVENNNYNEDLHEPILGEIDCANIFDEQENYAMTENEYDNNYINIMNKEVDSDSGDDSDINSSDNDL